MPSLQTGSYLLRRVVNAFEGKYVLSLPIWPDAATNRGFVPHPKGLVRSLR